MTDPADFTPEEWALLARAPFMTGLIVTLASPSGISGVLEESSAVSEALIAAQSEAAPPLVRRVAEAIRDSGGQLARPSGRLTPKTALAAALSGLKGAAALLEHKAAREEAEAFKAWLLSIAHDCTEAAKEGGFLGLGGEQVNEAERRVLKQIEEALGIYR